MSSQPKPPPSDAERILADLEHLARRHFENMDGLRKHEAHLDADIERHTAELDRAQDHLAHLPADAGAGATFAAKQAIIAIEFNRDLLAEQRANLQPELASTPAAIEANAKAVAALKAGVG